MLGAGIRKVFLPRAQGMACEPKAKSDLVCAHSKKGTKGKAHTTKKREKDITLGCERSPKHISRLWLREKRARYEDVWPFLVRLTSTITNLPEKDCGCAKNEDLISSSSHWAPTCFIDDTVPHVLSKL
jgi:hypothetical protein